MEGLSATYILNDSREEKTDTITEEVPLTIEVNGKELATLLCSPRDLKPLALGFLYSSGILPDISTVGKVLLDRSQWKVSIEAQEDSLGEELLFKRIYTSGCGKGIIYHNPLDFMQRGEIESSLQIEAAKVMEFMKSFLKSSQEYQQTRGVHSSALANREDIVMVRDDIGRHNAIDKIIGEALGQGIELEESIVLTSGRVSSEIVSKILRCRIPILVAAGAPTDQAVKIALAAHMTLVGRARARRLVIYSEAARIV